MERAFEAYGAPLENMTTFKYLGHLLTVGDDGWPPVVGNLCTARKSWGQLFRILIREGADPKVSGIVLGGEIGGVVVWGGDVGTNPIDGSGY